MAKKMKHCVDKSNSATSKKAQHQNVNTKLSKIKKKSTKTIRESDKSNIKINKQQLNKTLNF